MIFQAHILDATLASIAAKIVVRALAVRVADGKASVTCQRRSVPPLDWLVRLFRDHGLWYFKCASTKFSFGRANSSRV